MNTLCYVFYFPFSFLIIISPCDVLEALHATTGAPFIIPKPPEIPKHKEEEEADAEQLPLNMDYRKMNKEDAQSATELLRER